MLRNSSNTHFSPVFLLLQKKCFGICLCVAIMFWNLTSLEKFVRYTINLIIGMRSRSFQCDNNHIWNSFHSKRFIFCNCLSLSTSSIFGKHWTQSMCMHFYENNTPVFGYNNFVSKVFDQQ